MGQVVKLKRTIGALGTQAKGCIVRAAKLEEDAENWRIKAGQLLIEAKAQVAHGEWLPYLKEYEIAPRTATEYMELAEGKLDHVRENKRKNSNRRVRADLAQAQEPHEPDTGHDMSPAERWQASAGNLLGEIASYPAYWNKNMPGWEKFKTTSVLRTLLKDAEVALKQISSKIKG